MFSSLKQEGSSDPGYNMDDPPGHHCEPKKSDTKGQVLYYRRSLELSNSQRQEVRQREPRLGEGLRELLLNGDRVSVLHDEQALGTDGGKGCTHECT